MHDFVFEGQRIDVSISLGLAMLTSDMAEPSDLVGAADARLYEAKRLGRNRVARSEARLARVRAAGRALRHAGGVMRARILIAGCGFVGRRLAERLAERGQDVFALRRSEGPAPRGARALRGDLARIETLEVVPGDLDTVVYAVAPSDPTEAAYRAAYLDGVDHLMRVLRDRGEMPRRLLFCSSTAVYAQSRGESVDEDSATRPVRFNGEILLSAERLVSALAPGAIVVRFGGIYGPGRTRLIDSVRSGEARIHPREHFTNRIHRDDAAGVLELLALADAPAHDCYLGVDDEPTDEAEVLRFLASRLGVPEPRQVEEGAPAARRAGSKRCRNDRIRAEGYAFEYPSFRSGYAAMLG